MPTTTQPAVALLGATGRWFAQCHGCQASSPTWPAPDDLRVLAAARAAGWQVRTRPAAWFAVTGRFYLVCPRCVKAGAR
jgi:hypothetical protein